MILLIHKNEEVFEVVDLTTNTILVVSNQKPINALFEIAKKHTERILIWCHQSLKENLNIEGIKTTFTLKNMMLSYGKNQYFHEQIGYIEDSPFLKVNKKVKYPTWLMSSQIGTIYASELLKFESEINLKNSFDFVLNSIAKKGMPNGLLCYSEPKLLKNDYSFQKENKASIFQLFKFVKLHYKGVWSILLLLNFMVYEKRFSIISFIRSLFYKRKTTNLEFDFESLIPVVTNQKSSIDVIIPTIGRKDYLHDVLKDLSNQTLLPEKVIVIEQNENLNSKSELDFITSTKWPFKIFHKFIHQTGACNARNLALKEVTSGYVFFADDDIRLNDDILKNTIYLMKQNRVKAVTLSCLKSDEKEVYNNVFQWQSFGSGCSFVEKSAIKNLEFNMAFEHGFGEDADFGMQLRNKEIDVLYVPTIKLQHLKAPIGGFRMPYKHSWKKDIVQPKPSPTVMLNRINNTTKYQLLGYKTKLLIKFYKNQQVKNPFTYLLKFKKQWQQSLCWANKLKEQFN